MLEVMKIYTGIVEIVKELRAFAHMVVLQLGLHITLGRNNSNQTTLFECNAKVILKIIMTRYNFIIGMKRYYIFLSKIHIIF